MEVAGTANQTEIAKRAGLTQPSVNRWQTTVPRPANVVAFARAYERPVLEAFVAAGWLSEDDVQMIEAPRNLRELDAKKLNALADDVLDELKRRVRD